MNPIEFLKTIYFGDRFCTKIVVDGQNNIFEFHVNRVSRIRDVSGEWNNYTDEDIENAIIVIAGVKKVIFDDSGLIPNDQIYDIYATHLNDGTYEFIFETSHVDQKATTYDITIKIIGESIHLLDPAEPDIKIYE
jgi:hypothetical protein